VIDNERVFVVGLPRTGSTLLRTILNKSERICITAETHFLRKMSRIGRRKQIARFGDLHDDQHVERLLDFLYNERRARGKDFWSWLNNNVERDEFKRELHKTDRSDRAIFDLLMQFYAQRRKGAVGPEMILGEKTSANIYYVPTLFEWFPNVKIIHTSRDPRGIFVSAAKLVKAGKWGLREKFPGLPGWAVDPLLEGVMGLYVTKTWLDAARLHSVYEQLYPDRYCLVRFEDFLQDPEAQVRNLCAFLGVPFEAHMLEDVTVVGSSYRAERIVHEGIDHKAADRWKDHIHPLASAWFSKMGGKHLKNFGYAP